MKYYLIVGEASGDLHASNLMAAIRREAGGFLFPGVWLPALIMLSFDKLCKAWYNHEGSIWNRALPVTVGGLSPTSPGELLCPPA